MHRALICAALIGFTSEGCYSPSIRDCSISCGEGGSCPSGATCGADGLCHTGSTTSCLSEGTPDAPTKLPDAKGPPRCGDGIVTPPETCDVAIASGPGSCPTSCEAGDVCTLAVLVGDGCSVTCARGPVGFVDGDGCCPAGGSYYQDTDCPSMCGNGIVEPGEECDGGDGCTADCTRAAPPLTAFRIDSLVLQDPHVFPTFLICLGDQTTSLNSIVGDRLNGDASPVDGLLDLSPVLVWRSFTTQPGTSTNVDLVFARCSAPAEAATCDGSGAIRDSTSVRNRVEGLCVSASKIQSTTNAEYDRSDIDEPSAPCFGSEPTTLVLDIGGGLIPLHDARIAGVFSSDGVADGLLSGFISQGDADATILKLPAPLSISVPLGSLLAGDEMCCETDANKDGITDHDDRDVGPDGHTLGWYFYFNFTAVKVPYTE